MRGCYARTETKRQHYKPKQIIYNFLNKSIRSEDTKVTCPPIYWWRASGCRGKTGATQVWGCAGGRSTDAPQPKTYEEYGIKALLYDVNSASYRRVWGARLALRTAPTGVATVGYNGQPIPVPL